MKTIKQFLIDYSRDVISGEIVACEKHGWSCQRFLEDIKKGNRKFSSYRFEECEIRSIKKRKVNFMFPQKFLTINLQSI